MTGSAAAVPSERPARALIVVEGDPEPAHLTTLRAVLHMADYETELVVGLDQASERLHELGARIRTALRTEPGPPPISSLSVMPDRSEIRQAGPVLMDLRRRQVTVDREPVHLSRLEFDLLAFLLDPPDQVRSRSEILSAIWGPRLRPGSRSLDTHVRRLRLKLGDNAGRPRFLKTVHGFGIRFDSDGARAGS